MKEKILELLENIHEAKEAIEINDLLGYKSADEYNDLVNTLNELVDEHKVFFTKKEKYILLKNCPNLKIGKLSVNKKGFGFVVLEQEEDLYIDKNNLNGAIDGDIVLCEAINGRIKKEGHIIRVIERNLDNLVGELTIVNKKYFLILDDQKKDLSIEITKESAVNCVPGHKVLVKIVKKISNKRYLAEIVAVLGHKDDPGVDILSIAYKYGIYEKLDPKVEAELEDIPTEVDSNDLIGRRDLTNEIIFTIDGAHTKDIDDAISLELLKEGYRLGVHIADVSNYVKENTALGDDAYNRGTSSYLADTVIPMLPHKLSNGICSLNEGVIRLTMSCVMDFDFNGKLIDYDIFPSYIKSRKKMTYEDVNEIIVNGIIPEGYEEFASILKNMNVLAKILRKEKERRGYIDFDLDEPEIIQDENGKAIDIVKRVRLDGEKLIEDFMIAANETVANHIYNMGLPFIYRIHEDPRPEKIEEFMNLIKIFGYKVENHKSITPKGMQEILGSLYDKPEFPILSNLLLRSMRKAEYSKNNTGHFGIASKAYTHFTSPIRRFPDLTVHRLLKTYLVKKDMSMTTIGTLETSLVEIAEHSSEREVAAIKAERDVLEMKAAEYMEDHIGEIHEGMITSITNYGFFVELENLIDGLVHVNSLKGDYFTYVPEILSMIGKSTKKRYMLGDKVTIKVVGANKMAGTIDFEIVTGEEQDVGDKK